MTEPTESGEDLTATSRRRFLREGGAVLGGAVVPGGLGGSKLSAATEDSENLPPNVPAWVKTPGDPMGTQLYGTPSPLEKGVGKNMARNLPEILLASGRSPLQ